MDFGQKLWDFTQKLATACEDPQREFIFEPDASVPEGTSLGGTGELHRVVLVIDGNHHEAWVSSNPLR